MLRDGCRGRGDSDLTATGDVVNGDPVASVAAEAVLMLATPESGLFDADAAASETIPTSSSSVELRLEMWRFLGLFGMLLGGDVSSMSKVGAVRLMRTGSGRSGEPFILTSFFAAGLFLPPDASCCSCCKNKTKLFRSVHYILTLQKERF